MHNYSSLADMQISALSARTRNCWPLAALLGAGFLKLASSGMLLFFCSVMRLLVDCLSICSLLVSAVALLLNSDSSASCFT